MTDLRTEPAEYVRRVRIAAGYLADIACECTPVRGLLPEVLPGKGAVR